MPSPSSNLRVSVKYDHLTVFAGEDIEATVTFTNIAQPLPSPLDRLREPDWNAPTRVVSSYAGGERSRKPPISLGYAGAAEEQAQGLAGLASFKGKRPPGLRHKRSQSLMAQPSAGGRPAPGQGATTPNTTTPGAVTIARPQHGRTLSILSLATDTTTLGKGAGVPTRGHSRAASVQAPSRRTSGWLTSPRLGSNHPSPLLNSPPHSAAQARPNEYPFPNLRRSSRSPRSSNRTSPNTESKRESPGSPPPAFVFPPRPPPNDAPSQSDAVPEPDSAVSPMTIRPKVRSQSPETFPEPVRQVTRLLSDHSISGTPRSSTDLDSHTNYSDETLASEYIQQPVQRWFIKPEPLRRTSSQRTVTTRMGPETLMMGYAQVMGSFSVDGSLVNQAPFEEVKRKGIVGGQGGGGVVGLERSKRNSGLLGAFGWGAFTESLNGILGGGELSSLKEMKAIATSKEIPLLSTPQSVLFVDLRLAPGESKSYSYTFRLPRGLPPSFKGRAVKISYHLTIGTQRPASARDEQRVTSVDIPFRVLGSVNSRGEILGHDLMSPYIVLHDQARTAAIMPSTDSPKSKTQEHVNGQRKLSEPGLADFQAYITGLLSKSLRSPTSAPPSALLSPTDIPPGMRRRRSSALEEPPATQKEAIDLAILRLTQAVHTSGNSRSSTRFEIARSRHRVCTVDLFRPAYRLGETVNLSLDFSGADIPTYAVCVSLETQESVDPTLALRSAGSIARVTRKIHSRWAENVMYATRVGVTLAVPGSATPEFVTRGLSMRWKVRVEFVGPRIELRRKSMPIGTDAGNTEARVEEAVEDSDEEEEQGQVVEDGALEPLTRKSTSIPSVKFDFPQLTGEVSRDHRAVIFGPVERLHCDSFEIEIPIRIYGAVVEAGDGESSEALAV